VKSGERFWPARLRWRLRGAWMWPSFVVLTLLDGLLMHLLPPVRTGVDIVPGILLATFGNLVLVGAIAPWLARRIHARRPDPSRGAAGAPQQATVEVLTDRLGTGLLAAGVAAVLAAGLAARPTVVVETEEREAAAEAFRAHVQRSGDPELVRNVEASDTIRLGEAYFRTCVPRDDRRHRVCFLLDASRHPADVTRDRSAEPNSAYKLR
jgi:hypothetical protein